MRKYFLRLAVLLIVLLMMSCGGGGGGGIIIPTGSATLTWVVPTMYDDGVTPFTDLAGYNIHYGTSPGRYTSTINVRNVTTYRVTNLPAGATYYFVITAYNTSGVESAPSIWASKKI